MSAQPTRTRRRSGTAPLRLKFRGGLRLGDEAFWRLCQANPMLDLERSSRGDLLIMPPAGSDSDRRNLGVAARLWVWNDGTNLGVAFGPSAGFTLPNGAVRGPDAAWIARKRWEALKEDERQKFAPLCPEFVVELRSPRDRKADLRKKMAEYIDQGARLAWLIDPKHKTVEIYRPGRLPEVLKQPKSVSGEDVLPGFTLDLQGILS